MIVQEEEEKNVIGHKVERVLATLSEAGDRAKLLTGTRWGENPGKLDLRTWGMPETGEMIPYKGVTLNEEAAETLVNALTDYLNDPGN